MIYLIEFVFQIKQDLNLRVFNKIAEINKLKILTEHNHASVNPSFMLAKVT